MSHQRDSPEKIIGMFNEVEEVPSQDQIVGQICPGSAYRSRSATGDVKNTCVFKLTR